MRQLEGRESLNWETGIRFSDRGSGTDKDNLIVEQLLSGALARGKRQSAASQ